MNEAALKDRLKILAKDKGITFNECWKQLLLERFLARVSASKYSSKLIFKGGFLLSYSVEIGRETTDLDFLLKNLKSEGPELQRIFEEIGAIDLEDGFAFSKSDVEELAQPHMDYPGFRITLSAQFGKMKDRVQVDIGTGDAVKPEKKELPLFEYKGKPIFEGEITLLTYPLETIFAEKVQTAIARGEANSRMKDYHDLLILVRSGNLDDKKLSAAIKATFENRGTDIQFPITFSDSGIEALQRLWAAHVRGLGDIAKDLNIPGDVNEVIKEVNNHLLRI